MYRIKRALITGVTGQDGSYLAEFLLEKGYEVHGLRRRSSTVNVGRLETVFNSLSYGNKFFLHYGDMTDSVSLSRIVAEVRPDEVYNLAAQSHVAISFESPEYTANADALGCLRLLEAIRGAGLQDVSKFYQASTSEMFGGVSREPQNEQTVFHPRSPYGVSKLFAHWITVNYREAYGLWAVNGLLFNHESPRRGEHFVTKKIVQGLCNIKVGRQQILKLGNLDACRDWGHAKDYVEAMYLMLQQDTPRDLVIATGTTSSVRDFILLVAQELKMNIRWEGKGLDEVGVNDEGKTIIRIDPKYFRPSEVDYLLGDASLAKKFLGWEPKRDVRNLVTEMVRSEMKLG